VGNQKLKIKEQNDRAKIKNAEQKLQTEKLSFLFTFF
jgi:hypothetical protein